MKQINVDLYGGKPIVWDDGLADISEIHWEEEMKNIIEEEEKYYDMSGKYRY